MLVETPGYGYLESEEYADMMKSYIPNALAIVFVLNVANAGGILNEEVMFFIH